MGPYDEIIAALNRQGWSITDTTVAPQLCAELRAHAQRLWEEGAFEPGEFGLDLAGGKQPEVRGDAVCWIEPASDLARLPFFEWMAGFRAVLNERFKLGVRSQEFHFARYPEGRGYRKHLDQHRGRNLRKISVVLYLNPDWDAANGGELCFYQPTDPNTEIARLAPLNGRLAVFVSGLMPHAVLPCKATRWSVTGWLRTDEAA
ncbi:2OG-Fe(II) oxygenase [Comamonas sp. NLF-1-9]|uniref:2OG-Fe(II) oxygenase n=1 Tax=Comamonas sp. NLF-1-9 TaxID=2853163 RepID=UPI001C46770C|nr:2OG-Fe(II) oxygenase [Comamonas sp. NLF-1-9]QXL85693.1 2OG-Fe(II) oxygenase [Comamonas sp. NLF-1-9]